MAFTYYLPDEQGKIVEYETENNSVIIIGANGAGKSKLGAWMEHENFKNVHRIGAQRSLNFQENIKLKNYEQAEHFVFWGTDDVHAGTHNKDFRWNWGEETTLLLNDFESVLAALIALKNNENDKFIENLKQHRVECGSLPYTVVDKLKLVWRHVFPQRSLDLQDSKFLAVFNHNGCEQNYPANQMSDGERAVLYLASQVLCVPENKILIIDEPEVHLHRSIMNRLWHSLEQERPDCLFIYITHDTQFAAMHGNSDKIWIKEYDGQNWKLEKIEESELPEDLLLDILGSRKNVLFVEGEKGSYDVQLYSEIYPEYYVIPCGSCSQVIERTKTFKNSSFLHHFEVYGIIDRDYRSEYELQKLADNHIYPLKVAEVENLFLVEELIRFMAYHLGSDPDEVFLKVKDHIINKIFAKQIDKQICQAVVANLKYQLSCVNISKKDESEAKSSLKAILDNIDYDKTKADEERKFQDALAQNDYRTVLKVLNEKSVARTTGKFFGIQNTEYCQIVIRLLHGNQHDAIVKALLPYFPTEIPR